VLNEAVISILTAEVMFSNRANVII